jgi:hypothetical protein
MGVSREFLADKGIDLLIVGPLGGAMWSIYGTLWGYCSWTVIVPSVCIALSTFGMVEFVRYEKRRAILGIAATQAKPVNGADPKSQDEKDKRMVLGSWSVTNSIDQTYVGIWTFLPDQTTIVKTATYTTKGIWQLEQHCIRVTWESVQKDKQERCWDTFLRPINPTCVSGDCWNGINVWRGVKLHSPDIP